MGVGKDWADNEQGEFCEDEESSEPRGLTGEPKVALASTRGNAKARDEISGGRAAAAEEHKAESERVASTAGRLSAATGAEGSI